MAAVYKKGSYNFEDNFSLDLLQNMPLISIYRYTELLDAIAEHRNYRIYYAAQCTEVSTALSLAQLGIGIALVPYSAYKNNMGLFTGLEAKIIGDSECGTKCLMIYLKKPFSFSYRTKLYKAYRKYNRKQRSLISEIFLNGAYTSVNGAVDFLFCYYKRRIEVKHISQGTQKQSLF